MDNNINGDSELNKELRDYENERKMGVLRNKAAKNNFIRELKKGLGDQIKNDPNTFKRYRPSKETSFMGKFFNFIKNIFKSF